MKSILVTGANGFIGRPLCNTLKSGGNDVRAVVRRAGREPVTADEIIEIGDISGKAQWADALSGIDVVIHLAGRAHVLKDKSADPLSEFRRVNVEGTERLAKEAVASGVKRFVYVSSVGVNGRFTNEKPFTETDTPNPQDPYAISKWEAERALQKIASETGLEVVIVRPPLVYGPYVPGNFLRLLNIIDSGIPLPLAGINNLRSFVSVNNLADFLKKCALDPNAADKVFLVSDDRDISTTELVRCICRYMRRKPRLFRVPQILVKAGMRLIGNGVANGLYNSLQVDSSNSLHWRPPFLMQAELEKTVEWYKARDAR